MAAANDSKHSGKAVIWAVNADDNIYVRVAPAGQPTGGSWAQVDGKATCVGVDHATGVWVVNRAGEIYHRTGVSNDVPAGTGWAKVDGSAKNISCGGGQVWCVNAKDEIYRRTGVAANGAGGGWAKVDGSAKQINVDGGRVVAVNAKDEIYECDTSNASWRKVDGSLLWVSNHGSSFYIGGNKAGDIYHKSNGGAWAQAGGKLVAVDVSHDRIWGVNAAQEIYTCGKDFAWAKVDGKAVQISVAHF